MSRNPLCWIVDFYNFGKLFEFPQIGDGSFLNCNNAPSPVQPSPLPVIGDALEELFLEDTDLFPPTPITRPPVYRPPVQAPVEIPERKLPQEADGQTDFDTPDGRSISLQESLKNRKFGKLLWSPLTKEKIEVSAPKLGYLNDRLTEFRTESANNFEKYLKGEKELLWWEKTAMAFTDTPSGLGGELNLMFGLKWYREIVNANKQASKLALMKIHDFIPKEIKINRYDVNFNQSFSNENVDINKNDVNLENIEKILGIEINQDKDDPNYGKLEPLGELPQRLLNLKIEGEKDELIKIKNYPDLFVWFIKQFDSLIGQFPIEIEIEDTDVTKEGEQTQKIKLANIAEALREIYGLNIIESQLGDINFNVLMKLIPEIMRIRQEVLVSGDVLQACREFLGFRHKEIEKEIDNQFTMTTKLEDIKDIPAFLQGNTSKYKTIVFEGEESVIDFLQRIMYVSSIMKSSILKKVQTVDDFLQTIYEREGDEENKDWESFKDLINDPASFFNQNEKRSKLRDMGDLGGE